MYNVVFEYDETTGGAFGVRTWTSYRSKAKYKAATKNHTNTTVVAEGVSEEEAVDLTSLTPEVCRLMCAVEQAYTDTPNPDEGLFLFHRSMAMYAILSDREYIAARGLKRIDASKYIEKYSKRKFTTTLKYLEKDVRLAMQYLRCYNNLGQIR